MRRLVIVWIIFFISWGSLVYAGDKIKISDKGNTVIEAKTKELKVKATIICLPAKSQPYGSYYQLRSYIKNIEILVNGKKLFVPRSAYLDIDNANEVEVVFINNEGVLNIYGGDAAESYKLQVFFNSKRVTRRVVYDCELPDEPLEETKYWQRVIN